MATAASSPAGLASTNPTGAPAAAADPSIAGLEYCFSRRGRYDALLVEEGEGAVPVLPVAQADLPSLLSRLEPHAAAWASALRFKAGAGETCLLPSPQGGVARVLLGLGPAASHSSPPEPWPFAALAKLPPATYTLLPPHTPEPPREGKEGKAVTGEGAEDTATGKVEAAPQRTTSQLAAETANRAALGFLLGHYSFDRYKGSGNSSGGNNGSSEGAKAEGAGAAAAEQGPGAKARLVWPVGCDRPSVLALAHAFVWCRDLISTPAEDLGPQHLAAEAAALAAAHPGASFTLLQGEALLRAGYPAIHTVGRASHRPPVLATIEWAPPPQPQTAGEAGAAREAACAPLPLLALVGKGVCFDTGGLNLKSPAGMKLMKKDMGGAALLLALSHLVLSARLPVRLLLLVPAVENSVAGNAYRPLDVLRTRAGITVENGNSDAEGRLLLADCLAEALGRREGAGAAAGASMATESAAAGSAAAAPPERGLPDLLLDAATLTGAARAALGPDLPAVFTNDDATWRELEAAAAAESDPLWRLPLHAPYRKQLDSQGRAAGLRGHGGGGAGGRRTRRAVPGGVRQGGAALGAHRHGRIHARLRGGSGAAGGGRGAGAAGAVAHAAGAVRQRRRRRRRRCAERVRDARGLARQTAQATRLPASAQPLW